MKEVTIFLLVVMVVTAFGASSDGDEAMLDDVKALEHYEKRVRISLCFWSVDGIRRSYSRCDTYIIGDTHLFLPFSALV